MMQSTGRFERTLGHTSHNANRLGQHYQNESSFPSYILAKSKRSRNKNWELLEIQVLKKMIDNHYELLNSRHTNAMMNARKNLVWKRIADSINALGHNRRTVRELKIKWSNMRLTERRKTGSQNTSTSGSHDCGTNDIIDISQSSFESENMLELKKSTEKADKEMTSGNPVDEQLISSSNDRTPSDRRTNDKLLTSNEQSILITNTRTEKHNHVSIVQPNATHVRPQSWPRENILHSDIVSQPKTNIPDFRQDRVYMPGTVIKPEPSEYHQSEDYTHVSLNDRHLHTTATQTDWKLSSTNKYECPSLTVTDNDTTAVKFEILKLEREHLILKNQNMELQNIKLKMEISKLQTVT